MKENETYYQIKREEWSQYEGAHPFTMTREELAHLTSLNDRISLQDVQEVYVPMLDYFDLYFKKHIELRTEEQQFLHQTKKTVPFIIGVSGSVAVGKSTTARLMQTMLQQRYPDKRVYSHEIYDIVPGEVQTIESPDILIVEGINVLQLPPNREIYVSDFFDWSIFVDADATLIEQWYLERFELLMDRAKSQPDNYYYQYAIGNRADAIAMAKDVWQKTNLKNLKEYILPTKTRADFILHKTVGHHIDFVQIKKY